MQATRLGKPYEQWDEIATFNAAHVISGPTSSRVYRYGSLESLIQWAAIVYYHYFDKWGRSQPHFRYSNNLPASLSNPFLAFEEKTENETAPPSAAGLDYNYFRGVDDREPIFISRLIHVALFYSIVLGIGCLVIRSYGWGSVFILIPLLCLTSLPLFYSQTVLSLPNAINAILVFSSTLLLMMFYEKKTKVACLLGAVATFALALNFKSDVVVLAPIFPLALVLAGLRIPRAPLFRWSLLAAAMFVAALILGDPGLLVDPLDGVRQGLGPLMEHSAERFSWTIFGRNVGFFAELVGKTLLGLPNSYALTAAVVSLPIIAAAVLLIRRPSSSGAVILIGAAAAILCWAGVVVASKAPFERYFLNGLAAFYATIGMSLLQMQRTHNIVWQVAAGVVLFGLLGQYIGHASQNFRSAHSMYLNQKPFRGLDPKHNRNLASLAAVQLVHDKGYPETVLIDQHGYIDMRVFWQSRVKPIYINMFNINDVINDLNGEKDYLIVFNRGTYRLDGRVGGWEALLEIDWPLKLKDQYDCYQERLLNLPVVAEFAGQPQLVLSHAPVAADDEMFVSVLRPKALPGTC